MFIVQNEITDLKVKDRNIYKILYSMNSHQVATPEMSVEEARCYILLFSEGPDLSAYIGLYLPRTDRRFFYAYSNNPFPMEGQGEVESEARDFAEEMGFLLDEINVGGMAVEDRNNWIDEQYIFGYKRPQSQEAAAGAGAESKEPPDERSEVKQEKKEDGTTTEAAPPAEAGPPPGTATSVTPATEATAPAAPMTPPVVPQPVSPVPVTPPQAVQQHYPQQPMQPPHQQPAPQPGPASGQPPISHSQEPVPELGEPVMTSEPAPQHQAEPAAAKQRLPAAPQARASAKRKPSVQSPVLPAAPAPHAADAEEPVVTPQNVLEAAFREQVIKRPKPAGARPSPAPSGVVTRDKEALARLLASF